MPMVIDDERNIERLLRKRVRRINRLKNKLTMYLVRWVGRDPEYNIWMTAKQLLSDAKYHINTYKAAQKKAVVRVAPKHVPRVIVIEPPSLSVGLSSQDSKTLI